MSAVKEKPRIGKDKKIKIVYTRIIILFYKKLFLSYSWYFSKIYMYILTRTNFLVTTTFKLKYNNFILNVQNLNYINPWPDEVTYDVSYWTYLDVVE